ncbi:MAG: hypothetical protein AAB484_03355 [Patescibacteria group bacterium]
MNSPAKNFLTRAFPVPKSLSLSNVSVSLFDGRLSFFELKRSKDKLYSKAFGTVPFPVIRPSKLDEKQKTEAVSALRSFSKIHKYFYVHIVVHEGDAYVFRLAVPTTNPDELHSAIESVLEENVPIPPAEAIFEYDIISHDSMRNETVVAVSVVSEKIIESYVDLLSLGGLLPVSFETEARALSRSLFPMESSDIAIILAINQHHSVISIVEKRRAIFSSSIEVGAHDINQAVEKTMKKETDTIFDASLPVFSVIHDELAKVLVFWKTQEKKIKDFKNISRIILTGSDSLAPSFARYISLSFSMPVEVGSVWTNIVSPEECLPDLSRRDSLDYGALIGALLK